MARQDALNIYTDAAGSTEDSLNEAYGTVIKGIRAGSISAQIKNMRLSGDPRAGSVEVRRYKLSSSETEGTARTASKGDPLLNTGKKIINLGTNKEIVEEFNAFDVHASRLGGIMQVRAGDHASSMTVELDKAFFLECETDGTELTPVTANTTAKGRAELLIQTLEAKSNNWVNGLDRRNLVLTLLPAVYGQLQDYMDKVSRPTVGVGQAEFGVFHGVRVYRNTRQSENYICQHMGSVAQPVVVNPYSAPMKIPFSRDSSVELFYTFGTQAIMPDLIAYIS